MNQLELPLELPKESSVSYNSATRKYEVYGVSEGRMVRLRITDDPPRILKPPIFTDECSCPSCSEE